MDSLPVTALADLQLGTRPVERRAVSASPSGHLVWGMRQPARPLPPEWALRELADSDLDRDSEVLRLLQARGVVADHYFDPAYLPEDVADRLGRPRGAVARGTRFGATVEDARAWLKTLRALTVIWERGTFGEDVRGAFAAHGFVGLDATSASWAFATRALNVGLEAFQPRVVLGRLAQSPAVGLYAAACGQLFDLIRDGATPLRCANETCGRTFVHQVGASRSGRVRSSGIRFCSPACARAETQRQYRRRHAGAAAHAPPSGAHA